MYPRTFYWDLALESLKSVLNHSAMLLSLEDVMYLTKERTMHKYHPSYHVLNATSCALSHLLLVTTA